MRKQNDFEVHKILDKFCQEYIRKKNKILNKINK